MSRLHWCRSTFLVLHRSMGRGTMLTASEVLRVKLLHEEGYKPQAIADRIRRSRTAVRRVLGKISSTRRQSQRGKPRKISQMKARAVVRAGCTGLHSASQIKNMLKLPIGTCRIQQMLSDTAYLKWSKMKKAPAMTPKHKDKRVAWCREQLRLNSRRWRKIIFSDEKRFCLDGPDGLRHYWADTCLDKRYFSTRQNGGRSVMVWGAFSWAGVATLVVVTGSMNSEKYIGILEDSLIPFGENEHPNGWIFQQDGASCHTSNATKTFLFDQDIDVLDWPAKSPDLNPMENVWGLLVRKVYEDFRQFDNKEELIAVIKHAWYNIDRDVLQSLVKSMPDRYIEVLEKRGGPSKY